MADKYLNQTGLQYFWNSIKITDAQYLTMARKIAEPYDDTADYFVGKFCTNLSKVWECSTDIVGGETWTASHWKEIGNV